MIQIRPAFAQSDNQTRSAEAGEHLRQVTETALTRAQLERLIRDLGLYQTERNREPLDDVVQRMRSDIGVVTKYASNQFLDSQIGSLRMRLVERDGELKQARATGQAIPEADVIAYDVLRDMYKAVLVRREEARSVEGLERRSAGLQFQITEPARLPERPVGPSHLGVNAVGTALGLGLGLLLVGVRRRSTLTAA